MKYYRHLKTGGIYKVLTEGRIEATLDPVVVYQNVEQPDHVWVRPHAEFYDGRFEQVAGPSSSPLSMLRDVGDFHNKFGLSYLGKPRSLPAELRRFRRNFMQEELDEYDIHMEAARNEIIAGEAFDNGEYTHALEGMLDALVDLVYVALGTAYLHGFDFAEAWRRVHEANMKKVRAERSEDSKRGSTFDVIKPEGWEPPSHTDLVEDHDLRGAVT